MDESKLKYLNKYTAFEGGKQAKPYKTKNLAKSLWVVKPNWTVFKLFCKTVAHKPVTVLYPYEKEWVPENYRGRPGLRFDRCVSCGMCAHACVLRAISEEGSAPETPKPCEERSLDCDVLVIGSGPSGLCTSVRLAEQGKKVLVLEALNVPGGCGWYATFMRVFGTKWERDAGLPDNTEDYIRAAMNCTHWMLDYKLVSTGLRAVPEFFDWFAEWGKPEEVL